MVAVVAVARDFAASEGPGPLEAAIFGVLGGAALRKLCALCATHYSCTVPSCLDPITSQTISISPAAG